MRKFAFAFMTALAIAGSSQAVELNISKVALSVNPLGVAFGIGNIDAEFQAMNIRGFVPAIGGSFAKWSSGSDDLTAFGVYGAGRIFSDKEKLAKWFGEFGLGLEYAKATNNSLGLEATATLIYPYAIGGYRWLLGSDKWQIDLGLGVAYWIGSLEANGYDFGFTGFVPTGKLAVGYRF